MFCWYSCDEENVLCQCQDGGQTPPSAPVSLSGSESFLFLVTMFTVVEPLCGLIGPRHKLTLECVKLGQIKQRNYPTCSSLCCEATRMQRCDMNHQNLCDGTLSPTNRQTMTRSTAGSSPHITDPDPKTCRDVPETHWTLI